MDIFTVTWYSVVQDAPYWQPELNIYQFIYKTEAEDAFTYEIPSLIYASEIQVVEISFDFGELSDHMFYLPSVN